MHIRPPLPPSRKNRCSNSSATSLHSTRKRFFFVRRWLAPSSFLYSIVLTRDGRSSSRANPAGFLGYERGYWNFENPPRRCGQRRLCIRKKSLETAARFRPSSLSLSLCLSIHLLNSRQWLAIFLSLYYLVLRSNMRSLSSRKKYWDFYFFFFIVSFRAEHFTFSSVYFDYINYWNEMKLFEIQWKMKKF